MICRRCGAPTKGRERYCTPACRLMHKDEGFKPALKPFDSYKTGVKPAKWQRDEA